MCDSHRTCNFGPQRGTTCLVSFHLGLGRVVRTASICCTDFEPKDLFEPTSARQTCETDVVQGFKLSHAE